jgi:hypothetical protein
VDPVDFMLSVMSDDTVDMDLRLRAAGLAAPYLRAKLSPIEHKVAEPAPERPMITVNGDPDLPDFVRPSEYRDPDLPDFVRPE